MKCVPAFLLGLAIFVAGCDSDSDSSPSAAGDGAFRVFLSETSGNQRVEMEVPEETTFGEVKAFALGALQLSGQEFELRVAGKTPAATDTLADHGIVAPNPPVSMPAGNILVKIKD
ncbi:MAG: hypothetical protein P1U85_06040 [Verrucomicrobiales bacterium]|nr:hypothetical protein [Verrucomicrobiales bacterium]